METISTVVASDIAVSSEQLAKDAKKAKRAAGKMAKLATATAPTIIAPPTLTVEQIRAAQQKNELCQARKDYLRCIGGAKAGGGSDLVGRVFRAIGTTGFSAKERKDKHGNSVFTANAFVTIQDVIAACKDIDSQAALIWAESYISGLTPSKANHRRFVSFAQYIADGGFVRVAHALGVMVNASAFTYNEHVVVNGSTINVVQDIRQDITNIFGMKLTFARRAKFGTID